MADDPNNLLATRSALKQFLVQGLKRTGEGVQATLPLLPSARTPEETGQILGMGAAAGLLPAPADIANIVRTKLGDATFITDENRWRSSAPAAAPTAYGTNKWLDEQHADAINSLNPATGRPNISNSLRHTLNDLRQQYGPLAEIYLLNPTAYKVEQQRMYDAGWLQNVDANASGVTIDPNPDYRARIFIRNDPVSISRALFHEIAHPIVNRMSPEDIGTLFDLYSRQTSPNEFTLNYTRGLRAGGINYNALPTEEGIENGTEQYVPGFDFLTKDDMRKEMAAEALSGLLKGGNIKMFTRDPTLIHQAQQAFWRVLDNMGFDPLTVRSTSPPWSFTEHHGGNGLGAYIAPDFA
jgi:hypothetical protein